MKKLVQPVEIKRLRNEYDSIEFPEAGYPLDSGDPKM